MLVLVVLVLVLVLVVLVVLVVLLLEVLVLLSPLLTLFRPGLRGAAGAHAAEEVGRRTEQRQRQEPQQAHI